MFRQKLLRACRAKPKYRRSVLELCRRDPLFFINAFVWQFNPNFIPPKSGKGSSMSLELGPFVTWPFQDEALAVMRKCMEERRDAVIEKSREMGASWLCLLLMLWYWLFVPRKKFLLISRDEKSVDSSDPDSLMWKLDFVLGKLPDWMVPKHRRLKLLFENEDTGSFITGQASTGKAGVGGRAFAMFIDEFSQIDDAREVLNRTSDTTGCRIFNGTHKGTGTAFHDLTAGDASSFLTKIQLHWSQHPDKNRGLYSWDAAEQRLVFHDPDYDYPPDYAFVTDGTPSGGPFPGLRSPWYDEQCGRKTNARAIAEDLDIDAKGSVEQVFDTLMVRSLMATTCRPAVWEGDALCEAGGWRLVQRSGGPLRLWRSLNERNRPHPARYCFGVDLSTGLGTTNSCVSGGDAETGEKVFEYAYPSIEPTPLAEMMLGLCEMFRDPPDSQGETRPALLCWETPGPGNIFGKRIMDSGFRRVFYRTADHTLRKEVSEVPGWSNTNDSMLQLILLYKDALRTRKFVNRSKEGLEETLAFRYKADSYVEHSGASNTSERSGARINHGDRVVADALCYKMMALLNSKGGEPTAHKPDPIAVMNSLGFRRKLAEKAAKDEGNWA